MRFNKPLAEGRYDAILSQPKAAPWGMKWSRYTSVPRDQGRWHVTYRINLLLQAAVVLGGIALVSPAGLAADKLAAAQAAIQAGDLRGAASELRDLVRDKPQDAAARFELARVELMLNDPVSAERDLRAAQQRGYDANQTELLLGRVLLAQHRNSDLLKQLQPSGKNPAIDAEILALRGQAQIRLGKVDDAQASFRQAETLDPKVADSWVEDALIAYGQKDYAAASDRVEHALAADPKAQKAIVLKAMILRRNGDMAGAKALLDQTIADQPPAALARLERASILARTDKPSEAQEDLKVVLKELPGNRRAVFLEAEVLHALHEDQSAKVLLDRLQRSASFDPYILFVRAQVEDALGELSQAEDSATKYIVRAPGDVNGYKLLAEFYTKGGRPDQAIVPLKQAMDAGKADAEIYTMLGRGYSATSQPEAAAAAFAKAAELAPGNVAGEVVLAKALVESGQPANAVAVLEGALKKEPANPAVQEALVGAALATGDVDQADSALLKVTQTGNDNPEVQELTAKVQLARLDVAGAVVTLEKLIKSKPDYAPARITLARAYGMEGQDAKADALLDAVLKQSPSAEPALTMLVNERIRARRVPAAISLMERAHQATPGDVALTERLGDLYIRTGMPQKALELARAAQPADGPPSPQMLLLAANAQLALKQPAQARETLAKLVALQPRDVELRRRLAKLDVEAGEYEPARNLIKEGMRATPRVYALYLDYALVDLKSSGLPAALATAELLRKADLGFPDLNALKGDIYMAAKNPDEAIKAYEEALHAAPSAQLTERIANAYVQEEKPEEARAALAAWTVHHPDDLPALTAMSELDLKAGKLDDAESEFKAILIQQPLDASALNGLARVYERRGDPRARELAAKAFLLDPTAQNADTYGWILTRGGNAARGLLVLRQAVPLRPDIGYHLGVALNDTGQKEDAVRVLNAVVATKSDFSEKTDARKLLEQITKGS